MQKLKRFLAGKTHVKRRKKQKHNDPLIEDAKSGCDENHRARGGASASASTSTHRSTPSNLTFVRVGNGPTTAPLNKQNGGFDKYYKRPASILKKKNSDYSSLGSNCSWSSCGSLRDAQNVESESTQLQP